MSLWKLQIAISKDLIRAHCPQSRFGGRLVAGEGTARLTPMWGAGGRSPVRAVKTAQTFARHQWIRQIRQTSCPARAPSPPSARRPAAALVLDGVAGLARRGRANFAGKATRMEPEAAGELPRTQRFRSPAPGPWTPAPTQDRHLQCHACRRHPAGLGGSQAVSSRGMLGNEMLMRHK